MGSGTLTKAYLPVGTWAVDPTHSSVAFRVKHMGIATVRGAFNEFEGALEVTADAIEIQGKVNAASIDTNEQARDEHLRSGDFFDAETHPQITFKATSVADDGDDQFLITGDLTMHGITHRETLTAEVNGADVDPWGNDRVGLEVRGQLNRGDYEMRFNQALGSGNMLVSDKIKLELEISAVKK